MHYAPQTGSIRGPLVTWLVVLTFAVTVCLAILSAPLAVARGLPAIAGTIYFSFSYICHQIPARSFYLAEHPLAVCSRCTGIYAGFLLAVVAYPLIRSLRSTATPARKWLFIAAAPLAIDVSLHLLGVWTNTHSSRFITGALLGFVVVFYVLPGLIELSLRERKHSRPRTTTGSMLTNASPAPSDYSAPERRI